MTGLLQFAIVVLVQVSVICVVAGLLLALFRKSAARRHGIAVSALALLLVCPVLANQLPSGWLLALITSDADEASAPGPSVEQPTRATAPTSEPLVLATRQDHSARDPLAAEESLPTDVALDRVKLSETAATPVDPVETPVVSIPRSSSAPWLPRWVTFAVWIWLSGIVIALMQLVRRIHRLQPIRQSLRPIQTNHIPATILSHVRQQFAPASLPPLMTSDQIPAPVVLGLLRPVVVLPDRLLQESGKQRLADVLIHECAHIARGDHWIHAAQQIAGVLYWLHPGVRWLNHALATAREEVCDNYVLRQSDPTDYAQTLLELTEQCGTPQPVLSLLGLFTPRWSLESRIAGLLHPQRPRTLRPEKKLIVGITILLCSCSLMTGGIADDTSDATSDTDGTTLQKTIPEAPTTPAGEQPGEDSSEQTSLPAAPPDAESANELRNMRIHGYCEDVDGELIRGVKIAVYRYPTPTTEPILVAQSVTDDTGEFDFPDIQSRADLKKLFRGMSDLVIIATADGYASTSASPRRDSPEREIRMMLTGGSSSLSGTVTDPAGQPVRGATINLRPWFTHPIPGSRSAVTDDNGRYVVRNLPTRFAKSWRGFFQISHPDFAMTRRFVPAVSKQVDVILEHPGIVQGRVIDLVTDEPVPNVTVTAQGIARDGYFQTQTDATGSYRLRVPSDHYNFWAEVEDRMPLAIKALKVASAETTEGNDIRMSQGGFVFGRILDARGNPAPLPERMKTHVAYHGPARPHTGSAVGSVEVNKDSTYRLHVAPGLNYVYVMSGVGSAWIDVPEGQEVQHDFTVGTYAKKRAFHEANADEEFAQQLRLQAMKDDEAKARQAARHARWLAFPDEITQLDRALHRSRDEVAQLERTMLRKETERLLAELPDLQRPQQNTATRGPGQILQMWNSERLSEDFVQVSIGSDNGVADDTVLTVARGKKLICGVKVTHVTPDWSIGVVIKASRRGIAREGDRVTRGRQILWTTRP